jgi:hypothetical protein
VEGGLDRSTEKPELPQESRASTQTAALAEKGGNPHGAGVSGLVYVDARTLAGIPDREGGIDSMEVFGVLVEYL